MKIFIIGINDNQSQYFNPEIQDIINRHLIFSGGTRHHEIVKPHLPKGYLWIDITVPLTHVFQQYALHREIVIFASGDPLFFGFANTIRREMPAAEILLYPSFNSLQLLAHRLLMPYHDMHIVSLTGRPWHKFDEALITGYSKIGILTDNKEHTPSAIARRMIDYGYHNYTITIGELLGNRERERVSTFSPQEVADTAFAFPNCLILQKTHTRPRPFGIPENEFSLLDGRAKMITKMPVRLLSLSMLELRDKAVLWDIGFCTGSVSIEAKMQFPHLQIVAFEKRPEGLELLDGNSRRFGTPGIVPVIGEFEEADISSLPLPDAVFVGGHGGGMEKILSKVCSVLTANGVVAFNAVSGESLKLFLEAIDRNRLKLENSISIKVDDYNTIEVMKAKKI